MVIHIFKTGKRVGTGKIYGKTCKNIIGDYFVGYILDVEQKNSSYSVKKAFDYINSLGYKTMFYCMYADYNRYKDIIEKKPKIALLGSKIWKNDGRYYTKYSLIKLRSCISLLKMELAQEFLENSI